MGSHTSTTDIRRILDSFRQIVQILRLSATEAQRNLDLSAAQLFVLHKLGDGHGISMNELAARTHTHQSSVSVVVQRLVEKRLVRRQRARADARRVELTITAAGSRKLRSAPEAAQDQLIRAIERMPRRQPRLLAQLLERLILETGMSTAIPGLFFEDEGGNPKRKTNG
jgi:DNA-binding MarR family transcriptional regulator